MLKDFFSFFGDLYKNKRLLLKFSLNDFKAKYAGSMLGIIWAFINPTVTILVYWFVFEKGLRAGNVAGGLPFILFLIAGIIPWFFFSDTLLTTTNCFREYSYLVKKVVFNIKILPTAKLMSNLYTHLFFIAVTVLITTLYGYYPSVYTLQIFYYLFCIVMFTTGLTWITASLQPFLSDITQLIGVILQMLMWGTPILWSLETLQNPTLEMLFKLNPLYYVVHGYRSCFFEKAWFWQYDGMTLYFWAFTLIMMLVGSIVYNRLRPHFSDVL